MTDETQQPQVPTLTTRRVIKPWMVLAAVVILAVAAAAFFLLRGGSRPLAVSFELRDFTEGVSCNGGTGGYSDVGPGMDVVVRNNSDKIIGTGTLQSGGHGTPNPDAPDLLIACAWTAVINDLPANEDYYKISVGHRGEQVYSRSDLDAKDWKVSLVLGGA